MGKGNSQDVAVVSKEGKTCDFFSLQRCIVPCILASIGGISMRELHVKTVVLKDGQGNNRCYDYAILIGEMTVGHHACESYGMKISEQGGEQCVIPNITVSTERMTM